MKKIVMNIINLLLILFLCFNCYTGLEGAESVTVSSTYYKNEFRKIYYHLGIGGAYGGAYYVNIENNNTYKKYITSLRLSQERNYYQLGFTFRFNFSLESEEFSDELTYYGERTKIQLLWFPGVKMKFPSAIPFIVSYIPYCLIGGGYTKIDYRHMFLDENRILFDNEINGDGFVFGLCLGSEVEIMKELLYMDFGFNYLFSKIKQEFDTDSKEGNVELEESINYWELDYYIGFVVNLF